ncbi:MAG: hypothetical protein IJI45_11845 [Anaerolineaceae bacterium]|nr:hypothetical protein [Anaerolineaceae bacterium]
MKNKLLNFWYYHKVHVIIILVVLAVGTYFLLTQQKTVKSDYDIAIVSAKGFLTNKWGRSVMFFSRRERIKTMTAQ